MIRLLWTASAEVRYFLRRYMPSNIVLDLIRTRKGLKWGIPAMLLAGPYLAIAFWCTTLIESGGPGWLHLVVLLCIWNALKMLAIGPVSLSLLVRTWAAPVIRSGRCVSRRFRFDGCIAERTRLGAGSRARSAGGGGCTRPSSRRSRPVRAVASRSC